MKSPPSLAGVTGAKKLRVSRNGAKEEHQAHSGRSPVLIKVTAPFATILTQRLFRHETFTRFQSDRAVKLREVRPLWNDGRHSDELNARVERCRGKNLRAQKPAHHRHPLRHAR